MSMQAQEFEAFLGQTFPTPLGVFRSWDLPRYEDVMAAQVRDITAKRGPGDIDKLLRSGDIWEVPA